MRLGSAWKEDYRAELGRLLLWFVLLVNAFYILQLPLYLPAPHEGVLTFAGIFPDEFVYSIKLYWTLRCVFFAGAAAWLMGVAVPLSCGIAVASFMLAAAQSLETQVYTTHIYHFSTNVMLVLAAWHSFLGVDRRALRRAPLPGWVVETIAAYMLITYTYSGATKLFYNGLEWANGLSLQLWVARAGDINSSLTRWLMDSRLLAQLSQAAVLGAETISVAAIIVRPLRPLIGAVLFGFHLSVELLFDYGFYGNIGLVLIVLFAAPRFRKGDADSWNGSPERMRMSERSRSYNSDGPI